MGELGFLWGRDKGTPNQAELCVSQALEKTVGRGYVCGFLDFFGRKKPPAGGRAGKGRGLGLGGGDGGGQESMREGEGPPSGRGGRAGWVCRGLGLPLCGQGGQGLGLGRPRPPTPCAPSLGQLPREVTAGTCV